jgi:hypothetical protein
MKKYIGHHKPLTCLLLFCSIVLFAVSASAQGPYVRLQGEEIIVEGDKGVTVGWDAVSVALAYEVRLVMLHITPTTYFALARVPASETTVTFVQPRSGHFRVEARSCRFADCHIEDQAQPEKDVSRWAESTNKDDSSVGGVPMAWWIYWKLKGFTGPVIE